MADLSDWWRSINRKRVDRGGKPAELGALGYRVRHDGLIPLPIEGAAPSATVEQVVVADARATHTPRGAAPEHHKAFETLAAHLSDLSRAIHSLPRVMDGERTDAGEDEVLASWRMAADLHGADTADAVGDAWHCETHSSRGAPDPVHYDVTMAPPRTGARRCRRVSHLRS